ncbi:GTP cyclohydrolase II-domain-containing protein [Fimicolochytrium jonesii]|uniref:GTP cyclohydrolase II-domain-containing protein n=1 Tax=Fimicolochytrium jonesii TaxID=1396493 RepID=UPI0022FDFF85|nr:GTP cyclohydrolase II-domain-containing protein [Fimicolochytrium jonesii]KAI8822554.1 GTP cyclohydrolase II-domain-containing protein [Fimicolochytrium jonesii]
MERTPSPFFAGHAHPRPSSTSPSGPRRVTTKLAPLVVRCEVRSRIPSQFGGLCYVHLYSNNKDDEEHLALVYGEDIESATLEEMRPGDTDQERMLRGVKSVAGERQTTENGSADGVVSTAPLIRIHSCCFTGETLGSLRCDCAEQLEEAMRLMAAEGRGVVLYLKQEGRGIGLREKLRAYNLIDLGHDTMAANIALGHPADARTYEIASAMLKDLGVLKARLLTNNPDKLYHLQNDGIEIVERVPMIPASWRRMGVNVGIPVEKLPPSAITTASQSSVSPSAAASTSPSSSSQPTTLLNTNGTHATPIQLQDRDEYLVTKVQRMGHILNIPSQVLEAVNGVASAHAAKTVLSQSGTPQH